MLVRERQDQAVQPPCAQLGAQPAQPFRDGRFLERAPGEPILHVQEADAQLACRGWRHEIQPGGGLGSGRRRDHAADQLGDVLDRAAHPGGGQELRQFAIRVACPGAAHGPVRRMAATWAAP